MAVFRGQSQVVRCLAGEPFIALLTKGRAALGLKRLRRSRKMEPRAFSLVLCGVMREADHESCTDAQFRV